MKPFPRGKAKSIDLRWKHAPDADWRKIHSSVKSLDLEEDLLPEDPILRGLRVTNGTLVNPVLYSN